MLQLRGTHKGRANAAPAIGRRVRPVAVIATLVVLVGAASAYAAVGATRSKRPAPPPATTSLTSPVALDQDRSGQLPVVNINEAPGDFLNEGHDQIASVQNGALTISEAEKYGGAVKSTPTDLRATPNGGFDYIIGHTLATVSPWQDATYTGVGASWSLTSVKVAASASNIYMAGATWDDNDPVSSYQLHLYKLPHDGSCASPGCFTAADKAVGLSPSIFPSQPERLVVVTSLAVGVVGGKTLIAMGFSDNGILIVDENLNPVDEITDMAVPSDEPGAGDQTPPIRLAFGPPSGPGEGGVLAAGVVSPWLTCYAWQLNADGSEAHMTRFCGDGVDKNVIASTAVMEVNGAPKAVFGRTDGFVLSVDPSTGAAAGIASVGTAVTGLTGVTSWDDDPGNQHLVVGLLGGNAVVLDAGRKPIAIGADGATTGTWKQVRDWFPGYGAGRLQVANDTGGEVKVSMYSSQDSDKGCWLNASVAGGPGGPVPAFPTEPTPVAAGQSSPAFFIGALTAGVDGSCASAQAQQRGERAAYVVITPAGDPADQRLVKLRVDQSGVARLDSKVGGDLTVALEQAGGGGSWGGWRLRVSGPGDPVAQAPPAVSGQRLTSASSTACQPPQTPPVADDPCRPVYRFDVTGARWGGLGGPGSGQVTAQIPAMTAQGTVDGKNWTELGRLMPVTAPQLPSDGGGKTVTLGPASFFWQDAPAATPLTAVRVVSGGLASDPVTLAGLQAPPLDSSLPVPLGSLKVTPTVGVNATPRANGVDQAPLALALSSSGAGVIADNDPRYGLVYYRDADTHSLITGLYTSGDYADYVSVGPCRGAYPNDVGRSRTGKRRAGPGASPGACPAGSSPTRNYLVTTSAGTQNLTPTLNDSGTSTGAAQSNVAVIPRTGDLSASGSATGTGVSVYGCGPSQTTICTLVDPTAAPALYQAGVATDQAGGAPSPPATGLQFTVPAVTSTQSLPLVVGGGHTLASAPLNVTPTQAKLQNTSVGFASTDMIDTYLVSSGEQVSATVQVGGAAAGRGRPRPR